MGRKRKQDEKAFDAAESQAARDARREQEVLESQREDDLFRLSLQVLETQIFQSGPSGTAYVRREKITARIAPKPSPETFGTKTREEALEDQKLTGDTKLDAEHMVNDAAKVKQAKKAAPEEFQREQ